MKLSEYDREELAYLKWELKRWPRAQSRKRLGWHGQRPC